MKNKTAMFSTYLQKLFGSSALTFCLLKGIMILFLFDATAAFAADGAASQTQGAATGSADWEVGVAKLLNLIISVLYAILAPLAMLAGWFLTPDWTFGDIFGLRAPLHNLWILVSNVVYIIFALALIMIAFMHIFGEGEKDYAIKSALPRLAVGLIIVPFTWFIVSALSSVSNYFTASVIQLPKSILNEWQLATKIKVPESCTVNFEKKIQTDGAASGNSSSTGAREDRFFDCGDPAGYKEMTLGDYFTRLGKGSYNLVTLYAYSVFKFDKLQEIGNCNGTIQKVSDMSLQMLISIVFFFAYGLLLVALVVALGSRAIQLWFFSVVSPMFGLFYFFSKKGGGLKELEDKYGIVQLIQLAFVPVYVAAALVFGFVFIQVIQNASTNADAARTASFFVKVQKCSDEDSKGGVCQQLIFGEGLSLKIKGEPFSMSSDSCKGAAGTPNGGGSSDPFSLAFGAIGKIIVNILGLVVMWGAVMAALNSSKITKEAVKPIAEFGSQIGQTMADLPKNMPMTIPGTDKKLSMTGLSRIGQSISTASMTAGQTHTAGFNSDYFANLFKGDKIVDELKTLRKEIANAKPQGNQQIGSYGNRALSTIRSSGGLTALASNANSKAEFVNILKELKIKDDLVKKVENATTSISLAQALVEIDRTVDFNLLKKGPGVTVDEVLKEYDPQKAAPAGQNNQSSNPPAPTLSKNELMNTGTNGAADTFKSHDAIANIIKSKFKLDTKDKFTAQKETIKTQLTGHWVPGVDNIIDALERSYGTA